MRLKLSLSSTVYLMDIQEKTVSGWDGNDLSIKDTCYQWTVVDGTRWLS